MHYYCTAYVWIIFEAINSRKVFSPQHSVVFFEHANIVNNENYEFSVNQLIEKSFNHFDRIFKDEKFSNRKYRYCLSMNNHIHQKFLLEYYKRVESDSKNQYKNRISIIPEYAERDIFFEFDRFFSCNANLKCIEVNIDDENTINDLAVFYTSIYINEFKDPNERETLENMLSSLRMNSEDNNANKYHIIIAKNLSGTIVGGAIFDYYIKTNSGVIEFISVGSSFQSMGIGSFLYNTIYEKLNQDAKKNSKINISNIFCEIEDPSTLEKNASRKYYEFWKKYGFKKLNFNYIQPSLDDNKSVVDTLWFITHTINNPDNSSSSVPSDTVLNTIHDYIKFAMRIEEPIKNPQFYSMKDEIERNQSVELISLCDLYQMKF